MNFDVEAAVGPDEDRRAFLKSCGRFAVATPPAVTMLLSTSLTSGAIAASGGQGHHHGGGGGGGGGGSQGGGSGSTRRNHHILLRDAAGKGVVVKSEHERDLYFKLNGKVVGPFER
jgi:hypothetical protein